MHFTWSKRGAVALDGIEGLVTVDAETFLEQAAEKEAEKEATTKAAETDADTRDAKKDPDPEDDDEPNGAVDFLLAHGTECVNGAGETDKERALTA